MPFWRCFYHVIWATKNRSDWITSVIETVLLQNCRKKCTELGCNVMELGCVTDHIHIALTIPPSLSVAETVKQIKGYTSYGINQAFQPEEKFLWQTGYGVLTFGKRAIPVVTEYIQNQKQHHATGKILSYFEETTDQ